MAGLDIHTNYGGSVHAEMLAGHENVVILRAIDERECLMNVFMLREQAAQLVDEFYKNKCVPAEHTSYEAELLDRTNCRDEKIAELEDEIERLRESAAEEIFGDVATLGAVCLTPEETEELTGAAAHEPNTDPVTTPEECAQLCYLFCKVVRSTRSTEDMATAMMEAVTAIIRSYPGDIDHE